MMASASRSIDIQNNLVGHFNVQEKWTHLNSPILKLFLHLFVAIATVARYHGNK